MTDKERRRSQSRAQRRGQSSASRPSVWVFLLLAGIIFIGLAGGLVLAYGRNSTSQSHTVVSQAEGAEPASAAQVVRLETKGGDLPPLSDKGEPIAGWHDMANIPENFEGHPVPKDQPQPDIVVEPASRDVGTVGSKDVVSVEYVVLNKGNQDLVIDNVVTSCGCTTAVLSNSIIPPGYRADLVVRFDAGYHEIRPGERVVRAVWLLTNDPDTPVAEVRLTATIQ